MAAKVAQNKGSFGIAIGASGQGEAMVANRVKGVRAAVYYGPAAHFQTDADGNKLDMITSVRAHNDANVLSLGARFLSAAEAKEAVLKWLQTAFSGSEQHVRRLGKFN
jgi:ribose 5-phosphate isomerase B